MSARGDRTDDLVGLLADLVAIDSVNPTLVEGGEGEASVAQYVETWFQRVGLEVILEEVTPGRPNVIATVRGTGRGRTLALIAHTDTVTTAGVDRPLSPRIEGDRMYGRGTCDMKAGLAAAMSAAAMLSGQLGGDVVVAAVCDEEAGSTGTKKLLDSGPNFDAAIVTEPTDLQVGIAHKGFAGFEIETIGRAAHGSRPDKGVDAIAAMGPVLVELGELARRLDATPGDPILGPGSMHASLIEGGQEESSYPSSCLLTGEWRVVPGDDVEEELRAAIARSGVDARLRIKYTGPPFLTDEDNEIGALIRQHAGTANAALPYWTDAALLNAAGIPTVVFGPVGDGMHAASEWVDLSSVSRVRDVLVEVATRFCGSVE